MIKHIVMWTFKDNNKAEVINNVISSLKALSTVIPQIKSLEIEKNIQTGPTAFDVALITTFDSLIDLEIYKNHQSHQEIAAYVKQNVEKRGFVDFEY